MSRDALEEVYSRIIDAELGLRAIREILRSSSPADEPRAIDMRNNAVEWCATRMAEQLESISAFAEEQAAAEPTRRRS